MRLIEAVGGGRGSTRRTCSRVICCALAMGVVIHLLATWKHIRAMISKTNERMNSKKVTRRKEQLTRTSNAQLLRRATTAATPTPSTTPCTTEATHAHAHPRETIRTTRVLHARMHVWILSLAAVMPVLLFLTLLLPLVVTVRTTGRRGSALALVIAG